MAQMVKNLLLCRRLRFNPGWEAPGSILVGALNLKPRFNPWVEKRMATYASILAWRTPLTEQSTVHRVAESDTTEQLALTINI